MKQRIWTVVGLVVLGACVLIAGFVWEKRRYSAAYEGLSPGTDVSEVLKRFGKPTRIESCNLNPSWNGEAVSTSKVGCVKQFRYFSKISPEQWIVGFDSEGKAVTKYYFASP
jgi:hypothetical protein